MLVKKGKPRPTNSMYMNLWTWSNFDEEQRKFVREKKHQHDQIFEKIKIDEIVSIEVIMHSNPRWDVPITNCFFVDDLHRKM